MYPPGVSERSEPDGVIIVAAVLMVARDAVGFSVLVMRDFTAAWSS
jgi:hypothetical protein